MCSCLYHAKENSLRSALLRTEAKVKACDSSRSEAGDILAAQGTVNTGKCKSRSVRRSRAFGGGVNRDGVRGLKKASSTQADLRR
jgi:hypothetical protein